VSESATIRKAFDDYLFITDDTDAIIKFIKEHPPAP
jgi:hypothetical protein